MLIRKEVRTERRIQMVDITVLVERVIKDSGISDGICTVYSPHTTASVTVNEGHDPDVVADILEKLEKLVPAGSGYRHIEGNADSHIKVALMGPGVTIPIESGRLALGTWQRVFFCEFDGPRNRQVLVKLM